MSDKSLPLYRPSNGTEGDIFFESWCFRCAKGDDCEIPMRTMIHDTNEPEYPREWVRDGEKPRCTAFSGLACVRWAGQARADGESRQGQSRRARDAVHGDASRGSAGQAEVADESAAAISALA